MTDFLKQHLYTSSNILLYYLSPYCQIFYYDNGFILERSDLNKQLYMPIDKWNDIGVFFDKLSDGISSNELNIELEKIMNRSDTYEWIKYAMQGGIIE